MYFSFVAKCIIIFALFSKLASSNSIAPKFTVKCEGGIFCRQDYNYTEDLFVLLKSKIESKASYTTDSLPPSVCIPVDSRWWIPLGWIICLDITIQDPVSGSVLLDGFHQIVGHCRGCAKAWGEGVYLHSHPYVSNSL
jgi:hypothetical protein